MNGPLNDCPAEASNALRWIPGQVEELPDSGNAASTRPGPPKAIEALPKGQARRITKSEAGRQLGVDLRAVGRMIGQGDLRTVPVPAGVRAVVLQSSVDDLLLRMSTTVGRTW